jgi:multicomponent Na+:H+ antiporter subunit D
VFETNLKRMPAYSSVAQVGYITLGVGLANQAGLTGGLVHIVNHALMKAAWFLAVGAIFYRACPVQIRDLAGIGRKMPITMTAFTVACFGLVGTPGTSGFISKWYLALGALDKGWWVLVFLIVGSSLIALVYIGRVLEVAWLREPSPDIAQASDPPLSMLLPIVLLAAATIYFGIDAEWTAGIASTAAKGLLGGLR